MINDLQKYMGRTVDLIYLDAAGRFTRRRVQLRGIAGGKVRVYCYDRQAPRVLIIDNILAMLPVIGHAV